ncbi:MAG: PhnD/SsuA/transferrin family substrate-binding protein [Thermodesulfobacteriota bacterium]|nr:PhnD/SsuA/transferrin family substrate-binding protein [Thermodesulfobacteriota bacterium]
MFSFRISRNSIIFFLLLLFVSLPNNALLQTTQEIKIGILAKRGSERTLLKWSATAEYLSAVLPEHHFRIVPLAFADIHTAVLKTQIDFVLANPAFYVELEKLYGVNRIATLINQHLPGQQTTIFGGVIFVRADRSNLQNINDLHSHSFMAVDERSFGGWVMCWRELQQLGINPSKFFSSLSYGNTHDAVVHAVRNGDVDGGTVRTDTLERMAEAGAISLDEFRILNEQQAENFPFKLSTSLYPEWPFGAVKTTSPDLARQVASALLSMDKNEPAAQASNSAGWTVPLNYQPVHDCLMALGIGPYKDFGQFSFSDVLKRYWLPITLLLLVLTTVIIASLYFQQLNRKLKQKKQEVDELNATLEVKVAQRTQRVNVLLDQELYLREIMQTVAEVNGLLISETDLNMLLQKVCTVMGAHGHYGYSWIGLLQADMVNMVFTTDDSIQFPSDPPYDPFDINDPFSATPAAHCMADNQTMVVEQSSSVATVSPWFDRAAVTGYRAVIALPLRADKYTPALGALSVYTLRLEGFEQEEIAMLEELAGDIGFAISSFRQKEMVAKLEIERTENYEDTIVSFANMIDQRDTYTAGHTTRVAHYCKLIAREMGLSEEQTSILLKAATLHDIGKIATPDSVLLKPGKLSALDFDLIKLHASAGYDMLSNIAMYKGLAKIIRHHHERYDGQGYPDRLKGKGIPFLSRVITVADAFDAMTTNRIYKPRKAIPEALRELKQLSGSQFDHQIVTAALKALKDIESQKSINQLPKNIIEQRRFSYFFSDKLTGAYNDDYLQVILQNNKELHDYTCLHTLHIKNLEQYNTLQGWEQGNILMQKLAYELQDRYLDTLLFRAYGQYFVIISKEHFDIIEETFSLESLKGTGVEIELDHLDLKQNTAYYVEKMDKFEIQREVET